VITPARKQVAAERNQNLQWKSGKVRMAKKIHQRGLLLGTMNTKAAGDCAPILLFAALLIFAGISPTRLRASDATLRPGDMIDLKLGGVPSTETQSVSGQYQIGADGFVNMPNIGKVRIGGLSPAAAETSPIASFATLRRALVWWPV
jgi:protein involved in polysaccharide export with SLBB domain